MKKIIFSSTFILLIVSFTSCGDNSTQSILYPIRTEYEHFTSVVHEDVTEEQTATILDSLNNNYARIVNHLRVSEMPNVRVTIWANENSDDFYAAMQATIGQVYPGATGYTPSPTEMRLLYNPNTSTEAVHEFAHLVSMELNPNIGNNPRWLWEAVAQYESGMFDHPSTWDTNELNFPGFSALNQFNSYLPYIWGYYISSFIIENWGDDEFIRLIELNGAVRGVLGVEETDFGEQLEQYVRDMVN